MLINNKKHKGIWTSSGWYPEMQRNYWHMIVKNFDRKICFPKWFSFRCLWRDILCFIGWHNWSKGKGYAICNVEEMRRNPIGCLDEKGMAICIDICRNCGLKKP